MTTSRKSQLASIIVGLTATTSACGLEAFFHEGFDGKHEYPTIRIYGQVEGQYNELDSEDAEVPVKIVRQTGSEVEPLEASWTKVDDMTFAYELIFARECLTLSRVEARQGELRQMALVPFLSPIPPEGSGCGTASGEVEVNLSNRTTTTVLVAQARLSADRLPLTSLDPALLEGSLSVLEAKYDEAGAPRTLLEYVERIQAAANPASATMPFGEPGLTSDFETSTSALSLEFLDKHDVDYDNDGTVDTSSTATETFDAVLAEVASETQLDGCVDPTRVRVIFEVDFREGRKDGNCTIVNRFKWATSASNKRMFFVGGVHEESEIQDAALNAAMGAWQPNKVPMYDDGTNGDQVAGDNIWTIFFDMKIGTRVGYKYTWAFSGDLWTGSEEWPGNQRLLEAIDVNGDNFVRRRDVFQDEATNKDRINLYRQGMGSVYWDTDANGDGIPDARERPIDLDNDCTLDEWITPVGVGPATVDCAELQGQ